MYLLPSRFGTRFRTNISPLILLLSPLFRYPFIVSQLFKNFKFSIFRKLIMLYTCQLSARLIKLNSFTDNTLLIHTIAKFMIVNLCRLLWFWTWAVQSGWHVREHLLLAKFINKDLFGKVPQRRFLLVFRPLLNLNNEWCLLENYF